MESAGLYKEREVKEMCNTLFTVSVSETLPEEEKDKRLNDVNMNIEHLSYMADAIIEDLAEIFEKDGPEIFSRRVKRYILVFEYPVTYFEYQAKHFRKFRIGAYKQVKEGKRSSESKTLKGFTAVDLILNLIELAEEIKGQIIYAKELFLEDDKNNHRESDVKANAGTTAQQVLAMHYLFEYTKVRGIDNTAKAHFIEFLTGKNYKNIYDLVRSPLSTKTKKFRKEDLQFVRGLFEDLQLGEIVKMINNELDKG